VVGMGESSMTLLAHGQMRNQLHPIDIPWLFLCVTSLNPKVVVTLSGPVGPSEPGHPLQLPDPHDLSCDRILME
jgi:hypothetical protein